MLNNLSLYPLQRIKEYAALKKIIVYGVILFYICLEITGCGFQLRDQNKLPLSLHILYLEIDDPYSSLSIRIRQALQASNIVLTESPSQANVILQLSTPLKSNTNTLSGPSSQAHIYQVNYSITLKLLNSAGKAIIPPKVLHTSRSLTLGVNQLLQSNNQLDILTIEMEREIVSQLFNYLSSQEVAIAFKKAI